MNKLYKYQRKAVRALLDLKARAGVFMDMGTGKTLVTIETISRLRRARRILVVLPLSAAGVWRKEVHKWAPEARTVTRITDSVDRRAEWVKKLREHSTKRRVYLLVGYESFWREPLRREILRWEPDAVIYDEAHRLKSRSTRQAKFAHSLAVEDNKIHTPKYILGLTGTPMPNGAHDAFSIYKAINPKVFGTRYGDFEHEYVEKGGYKGYQIMGYKHLKKFKRLVAANSYRITKDEALDLPEQVDVVIPVELTKRERRYYDRMAADAITQIDEADGKGTAIGKIVLSQELRLQQIASGFVRVEEKGKILTFDSSKKAALKDLLEDVLLSEEKVVIFCRFRRDIDAALEVARKFKHVKAFQLDGRIKRGKAREKIIRRFNKKRDGSSIANVLVAQIQIASLAIDLTPARVAIFYSRNWSYVDYDQARARLHRHGQKRKVTYYHLIAEGTIDAKIQKGLEKKENTQRKLLRDPKKARRFFGG